MNLTPAGLIEKINKVSDEYFALSQELAEIAERKGMRWLDIKSENIGDKIAPRQRTNAEVDKVWEASADGRRESYLKIYLKGLEKLRGALVLEHRANNPHNF